MLTTLMRLAVFLIENIILLSYNAIYVLFYYLIMYEKIYGWHISY
jgi:hypothetical protein